MLGRPCSSVQSMDDPDLTRIPSTQLSRRNSIATSGVVPRMLTLPTKPHLVSSFPNGRAATSSTTTSASSSLYSTQSLPPVVDFKLISIKPLSYTSLKDLLPATAVQSPTAATPAGGGQSGCEISIRNRLVKQAAWAYLQPMSASPDSSGRHFFHRFWARISGDLLKNPVTAFLRCVAQSITRVFDRLLRTFRVRSSR